MKTKCYSVRVKSLVSISDKAVKISSFNGNEDIFPKSQIFGQDWNVMKSDAYWIATWILEKKNIQYSRKKEAWFYNDTREMAPNISITKHVPENIEKEIFPDKSLER